MYNVKLRHVCSTIVALEKQWVQHNPSMFICSLRYPACNANAPYCHLWPAPTLKYFFTLSHKQHDLKKKVLNKKMCVLIFYTTFVWNLIILSRNKQCMIQNIPWRQVKYPLFSYNFNETWIFLTDFKKILKYQFSWKSVQWELRCSMQTDRWTDMMKLIVAFHYFANTRKICFCPAWHDASISGVSTTGFTVTNGLWHKFVEDKQQRCAVHSAILQE